MIQEYLKSGSPREALEIKKKYGAEAAYIAGGTEVNRLKSPVRASRLIGLDKAGFPGIEKKGSALRIGAMVSLQELIESDLVPEALKKAARQAGSRPMRHMATAGGNIAADRRDSYLVPALLAFDAKVELAGGGEADLEAWLEKKEELVLSILIANPGRCVRLARISRTVQGVPVLVMAYGCGDGAKGASRFALGGLPGPARRLKAVEEAIDGGSLKDPEALAKKVSELVDPVSDFLGSVEYKRYIAGVSAADLFSACSC